MRGANSKAVRYILLLSPLRVIGDLVAKKCVSCAAVSVLVRPQWFAGKILGVDWRLAYFSAISKLLELHLFEERTNKAQFPGGRA